MLGDRKAVLKCQNQTLREGAIPLLSLTNGCPSRLTALLSPLLLLVSDLALYVSLRIGGPTTQTAARGRRGLSLLRDLGLRLSTGYLRQEPLGASMLLARIRHSGRVHELQLPLLTLPELSSASEDNNVVKSSMHYTKHGLVGVVAHTGQNTPTSGVNNG